MNNNFVVFFPEIGKGGAERVLADIGNFMVSKNWKVTFLSLGPVHDYKFLKLSDKIEIIHFPRKSRFDFSAFKDIEDILISRQTAFVFCVDFFSQLFVSILRKNRKLEFKILVNLHITVPKKRTDYLVNFFACRYLRKSDWVVFISKNQEEYVTSRFLLKSNCKKSIVYNGIDTSIFKIISSEEKAEQRSQLLNVSSSDKLIIKVAGIRIEKDHETAIRALKSYHDKFSDKPFLILLGDGPTDLTEHLKNLAQELSITDYVKFVGFNSIVNKYLGCADIFTLTSHSVETFSLAALEAMSCGLPVVLTDIGGANEMVLTGVNGYLSTPKNAIDIANKWKSALTADFDHENIRASVVKQYDISAMCSNYFKLFAEI